MDVRLGMDELHRVAFEMKGAREALELAPGAEPHFEYQSRAIEHAASVGDALGFDLSKGLIDTVCKTILGDHGITVNRRWDTPKLVREAFICLTIADEDGQPTGVPEPIRITAQGLAQAMKGLCELRNCKGTSSHGRDAFERTPEASQVVFAARAADAVVSLIFQCHQSASSVAYARHLRYEDNALFNEYLDEVWGESTCAGVTFAASRVLYEMETLLYRELLLAYQNEATEVVDDG
jgi:hypothetical protein